MARSRAASSSERAFGITSNNAVTGAVRKPWDTSRIPGGGTGGCGAAIEAVLPPMPAPSRFA